jgi:hypothetical protein
MRKAVPLLSPHRAYMTCYRQTFTFTFMFTKSLPSYQNRSQETLHP